MARQVQVILTSDLTGDEGDVETVGFGVDGVNYEVDLTAKEAEKFRHSLGMYVDVARKVGRSGKPVKATRVGPDTKAVKAWADSQGIEYPKRGRLSAELIAQFEAAQQQ